MANLNDYGLASTAIEEWLYWGGIVRPTVLRQKDYSFLSIIAYKPYTVLSSYEFPKRAFGAGWVVWNEHQHGKGEESQDYLILLWHPFITSTHLHVENTLGAKIRKDNDAVIAYFEAETQNLLHDIQAVTDARLLEYQEIIDVLSFSLSLGHAAPKMPDCPLYLDVLLSQDLSFQFQANDIFIDGKRVYIVSILAPIEIEPVYETLSDANYRHVRRFSFYDEKQARRNLAKYTAKWFPARSVIRKMALDDLLEDYNGYETEAFVFYLDEKEDASFQTFFTGLLDDMQASYLVERYKLKQVFWGACIGNYQANQFPPVVGIHNLAELMTATIKEDKRQENVLEQAQNQLVETSVDMDAYIEEIDQSKENPNGGTA